MIGILGGYGAVGAHAARLLGRWGAGPLRIGGRDAVRAKAFIAEHLPDADAHAAAVDIDDDTALAAFVRGCSLVVHCAGPSYRTSERVTYAALVVGADVVDAGGGDRLERIGSAVGDRTALYAAGALPGLSGLLPRWAAARHFDTVHGLTAYAGVLDRFTATGAADYLDGVLDGPNEPLAAWRDGARRSGALTRLSGQRLPHFVREVTAHPYLDAEGERLARDLSLTHGSWYTAVDGVQLPAVLDAARGLDRDCAVAGLCRATALDIAGRTPYVTLLAQLDGTADGQPATRTAVLRAPGIAPLTGAVTAVAALAVLCGEVPSGARCADAALDPVTAVERLRAEPDICELTMYDVAIDELAVAEEGAL
ncbi:saccharopine dehydrogenase NADP-binding domain-containing protein [Streptomyces sp. NRRL S-1448]|uniref:saccharopine dehydrogenase NADP-binding domain-containing protein n=1 Tax=Streptomyces sp. NRRL S-1448 TaxID=1463883 RepID=UPI0004BE70BF|nr:saccharopine dehydrogenase NADP-binding domain-containing protein [Streptomyces sp. NRRL S-1448]